MKKSIFVILSLFISFLSFGQEITKDDIINSKMKSDIDILIAKEISVLNGAGKEELIQFSANLPYELVNDNNAAFFNQCTKKALQKAKLKLKNTFTFIPRSVSWIYFDNAWGVTVLFSAQNDFGALKDGDTRIIYDSNCNEIN